jgi:hypothetical protein
MSVLTTKANEYTCKIDNYTNSLQLLECEGRTGDQRENLAVQAGRTVLEEYESAVDKLIRMVAPSPRNPVNSESKEALEAAEEAKKALE